LRTTARRINGDLYYVGCLLSMLRPESDPLLYRGYDRVQHMVRRVNCPPLSHQWHRTPKGQRFIAVMSLTHVLSHLVEGSPFDTHNVAD
jgi:hypothetical protein